MMDVAVAAERTLQLLDKRLAAGSYVRKDLGPAATFFHLNDMLRKIQSGEVKGEQAHRWLGWIQGVTYMRCEVSLEELKIINKEA